jgi:hypothetical protein
LVWGVGWVELVLLVGKIWTGVLVYWSTFSLLGVEERWFWVREECVGMGMIEFEEIED